MRRSRRTVLFLLLIMSMLCISMTASAASKAKKVTLNKKKVTLTVGKTVKLKAKVKPASANQKVTWKSSNKKVAAVSSKGIVTAKKAGNAIITCTVKKNKKIKATCKVTVKKKTSSSTASKSDTKSEDKVTLTDSEELENAKSIIAKTGEPLYQWKHGNKTSGKKASDNSPIYQVGTTANGVMSYIKVYNGWIMKGYTYCNKWGGPSITYAKEVQSDNSALKDGTYDFAADPS